MAKTSMWMKLSRRNMTQGGCRGKKSPGGTLTYFTEPQMLGEASYSEIISISIKKRRFRVWRRVIFSTDVGL